MAQLSRRPGLARRLLDRLVAPYAQRVIDETRDSLGSLQSSIDSLHGDLGRVHADLQAAADQVREIQADAARVAQISRLAYDEEPRNRRLLNALRDDPEYDLAFTEENPLVTFLVPTYNSYETLRDVCLPSILGQTHANVEAVVVGDAAVPETAEAIEAIGDPRVRYLNRPLRGPYPEDPGRRWYVIGTPPYNEALSMARGRWIAALGDDDAARPDHVERLLARAREERLEHCYGLQEVHFSEGEPMVLGAFPPVLGEWGLQGAIFHSGLRFFESELADAIYEEPNDWSLCRRMLRAGVRFGMLDEVVVDKHETRRASAESWREGGVPRVD